MSAADVAIVVAVTVVACVVVVYGLAWMLGVKRSDGDQSVRERGFKTWQ